MVRGSEGCGRVGGTLRDQMNSGPLYFGDVDAEAVPSGASRNPKLLKVYLPPKAATLLLKRYKESDEVSRPPRFVSFTAVAKKWSVTERPSGTAGHGPWGISPSHVRERRPIRGCHCVSATPRRSRIRWSSSTGPPRNCPAHGSCPPALARYTHPAQRTSLPRGPCYAHRRGP